MRRVRPWAAAAALTLAGIVATSCSIPTQGSPSAIPNSKVPFHLLDPHLPTTTTTQPKLSSLVPVKVYFIDYTTQQLTAEPRVVTSPAPLASIITAMLAGPSSAESQNVYNAIPSDVTVLSATQTGNLVVVNMNTAFGQITGINAELAVAQIVATVANEIGFSSNNGLGPGVILEIDGQRTSVPVATGSEVNGPVYLIQYLGTPGPA